MAMKRRRRQKHLEPGFEWEDEPLGEIYDVEIAKFLGTSKWTVQYQRKKLGIAGRKKKGKRTTYAEHYRNLLIDEAVNWYDMGTLDLDATTDLFMAVKAYKRALEE
jgi:hypothetical protein